jgi:hypothetical protein
MGLELRELGKHFTKNFGMVFWLGIFRIKPVEFDIYLFFKIGFDQKAHDKTLPKSNFILQLTR